MPACANAASTYAFTSALSFSATTACTGHGYALLLIAGQLRHFVILVMVVGPAPWACRASAGFLRLEDPRLGQLRRFAARAR